MDKKKKIILTTIISIIIVFLLFLLVYANFIAKDDNSGEIPSGPSSEVPSSGDDDKDEETEAPSDFEGETNNITDCENCETNNDGTRYNNSSKLLEEHKSNGITITNMSIFSNVNSDYAKVNLSIRNDTGEYISNFSLLVTFYDKNKNVISEVYFSSPSINPGQVVFVQEEVFKRVIDAYDYSFNYFFIDDESGGGL